MANAPRTATYTNDPAGSPLDRVRFELGDTDCASARLSDEEIRALLSSENDNALRAASVGARAIGATFASSVDFSHGPVSKSMSQASSHYADLADSLMRRASDDQALAVGLADEVAEKEAADTDESRVQPSFKIGQQDNPRSGPATLSRDDLGTV